MTGFVMKLIACPLIILLADYFLPNENYPLFYQPIIVGLILAIGAHLLDVLFLRGGKLWISTIMDLFVATLIVYYTQYLFPGAYIAWTGAALSAFLFSVSEAFAHLYLIGMGKV